MVRARIQSLTARVPKSGRAYGVLGAPHLGPMSQRICREAGVGFLDLAGNCRLVFDQVFIERLGSPKPAVERRALRSLFSPKAGRALRVLLAAPRRRWRLQALALEARVSLGLAFKVKQRLLDLEYAAQDSAGIRLSRPEELLRAWSASYVSLKSAALDCYASGDQAAAERALGEYCRARPVRYGLALFSGAARLAPVARSQRGFAYVAADPAAVARSLGWTPVPSGANFTLLVPFDEGVWYGTQQVEGDPVVSDVQLFLDLASFKGRGEEAATAILEQRLRPRW